jgi:hypothetical protein
MLSRVVPAVSTGTAAPLRSLTSRSYGGAGYADISRKQEKPVHPAARGAMRAGVVIMAP